MSFILRKSLSLSEITAIQNGFPPPNRFALPKFRKALGDALSNVSNCKISFIGDSTWALNTHLLQKYNKSIPYYVGSFLESKGFSVNKNVIMSDPTRLGGVFLTSYDSRWVTAGTQWAVAGTFGTFGGVALSNATTTETLSINLIGQADFDSYEIFYTRNAGYATFTTNVDGGATLATIDSNGARNIVSTVVNCALGQHTININRTGAGGQCFILAVVCRNSTINKNVEIYNGGLGSATSADILGSVGDFTYLGFAGYVQPHLTFINIGTNDRRLGNYTSAFDANLDTVIKRMLLSGDVVVCVPAASSIGATAFTTTVNQNLFNSATEKVAAANNVPVYSIVSRFGSYEYASPLGFYADVLHFTPSAMVSVASDICSVLIN